MTSFFNANAFSSSRSIVGFNNRNNNSNYREAAIEAYKLQQLFKIAINQLSVELGFFKTGDFDNLKSTLESTFAQHLADIDNDSNYNTNAILTLDNDTFKIDSNIFDNYRITMRDVLNGLTKGVELQETNNNLREDLSGILLGNIIPNLDQAVINQYFANKHREMVPFVESELFTYNLEIKTWYSRYFTSHGPPINGVFDLQKLSAIVNELITEGVITWEQFVQEENYDDLYMNPS
jgi:hypothetical protein